MSKGKGILYTATLAVFLLCLTFFGLVYGKSFLAPFTTAFVLSLIMLPLANKLEKWGMNRTVVSLINTFLLFLVSLGFFALFTLQIKKFWQDWPQIQETMRPKVEQLKSFVVESTSVTREEIDRTGGNFFSFFREGSPAKGATTILSGLVGFLGKYLITFVYVFFMLNYRKRFKVFLTSLFPKEKREAVRKTIKKSAEVAQAYLIGKLLLMAGLAVVYSIGLGLSGVDNFIIVSAIAALFTLIPYIGNIVGLAMAMSYGYLTSGDMTVLIGVILTFTIAQTIESYVLQPYVVGDKVNLHPFVVIIVVIIGNYVWGIIGMILAIPVMAILTTILLNVPSLRNYGILFSQRSIKDFR